MISALFVETDGAYFGVEGVDPWDAVRDARKYTGPNPVVAHPPCFLWVNMAAVNWKRYQRERPAWYPGGSDGDCFESALCAVRIYGGVLEHPAFSHAWERFGLLRPSAPGWQQGALMRSNAASARHRYYPGGKAFVCEVWQSAYGHAARKRTWLYYVGKKPAELDWSRKPGTHQVGWFDRIKPTLSKKEASRTPPAFRDALISLAKAAR